MKKINFPRLHGGDPSRAVARVIAAAAVAAALFLSTATAYAEVQQNVYLGEYVTFQSLVTGGSVFGGNTDTATTEESGFAGTGTADYRSGTNTYRAPDNAIETAYTTAMADVNSVAAAIMERARRQFERTQVAGMDTPDTDLIGVVGIRPTDAELAALVNNGIIALNLRNGTELLGNRYGPLRTTWRGYGGIASPTIPQDESINDITNDELDAARTHLASSSAGYAGASTSAAGFGSSALGNSVSVVPSRRPMVTFSGLSDGVLPRVMTGPYLWDPSARMDIINGGMRQSSYKSDRYIDLAGYFPEGTGSRYIPGQLVPSLPTDLNIGAWGLIGWNRPGSGSDTGSSGTTPGSHGSGSSGTSGTTDGSSTGGGSGTGGGTASGTSGTAGGSETGAGSSTTAITNTAHFAYIRDYRLTAAEDVTMRNITYDDDTRYWDIYNGNGSLLESRRTDGMSMLFVSYEPGDYVVRASRMATYETQRIAYYRDLEYLVDTTTGVLIDFRESETLPINLHTAVEHDLVPTGEVFRIHVLQDGSVEREEIRGGGVERVE